MSSHRTEKRRRIEFGDFQTPRRLASEVCRLVRSQGIRPGSIVEPTCGKGSFILSACDCFGEATEIVGVDINASHLAELRGALPRANGASVRLLREDFFAYDWASLFGALPEPILIIGNPPWVTNSQLGTMCSANLPAKANFQNRRGLDAVTGKANFDISEWMLLHLLRWTQHREAHLAMLCKTSVARKVLEQAWAGGAQLAHASMYLVDAREHFGASVDACLLVCSIGTQVGEKTCPVYSDLSRSTRCACIGVDGSRLLADIEAYRKLRYLDGQSSYRWRSGVKHDCAKVMEFVEVGDTLVNGLGEQACLEPDYLYPLVKSSDVARDDVARPRRWVLVTQERVGQETVTIEAQAPKTWQYLSDHAEMLDSRKSAIYTKGPRFSVFGIGDYSFSRHKAAVSGLYKEVHFATVGPSRGKPIMLDDTCYLAACGSRDEAALLTDLLNSELARDFLRSLVFWDAKRPITADVLRRIDTGALARELGRERELLAFVGAGIPKQQALFPDRGVPTSR